jgi:hypothetical protein
MTTLTPTRNDNIVNKVEIDPINKPDLQTFPRTGTLITVVNYGQPYVFVSSLPLHTIIATLINGVANKRVWSTNVLRYFLTCGMTCPLTVDPSELTIPEIRIQCNDAKFYWSHDNWKSGEGRSHDRDSDTWFFHNISDTTPFTKNTV